LGREKYANLYTTKRRLLGGSKHEIRGAVVKSLEACREVLHRQAKGAGGVRARKEEILSPPPQLSLSAQKVAEPVDLVWDWE